MNLDKVAQEAVKRGAIQKPWELAELGRMVASRDLRNMVEVGTFRGGTSWFFHQMGLAVISVDLIPHGLKDDNVSGITCILGNSPDVASKIGRIDLVFIDGNHSYEGVSADWTAYHPKVRGGGLVAFHDVVEHPPAAACEVARLWDQVSCNHPSIAIVDPRGGPWGGIGVLPI